MYWIAISPRLSRGKSTPAMRAMWTALLALPLLVTRILADDAHRALSAHDLAMFAPHLDGWSDFHALVPLLEPIGDAVPSQIVGRQLDLDLVARKDPDEMHPHLAGDVSQDLVAVVQLDPEQRVRQRLHDCAFHLDGVFLGH